MRLLWSLSIGLAFVGCASFTTDLSYRIPNQPSSAINTVVVVALTPDVETRKLIENELVYWLRQDGYDAIASVKVSTPSPRLPTEKELRRIVNDEAQDGVLTMRLIDVDKDSRYVSSTETRSTSLTDTYVYNYLNAWRDTYVPGYYANSSIIKLETNVYEVSNEQIVFTSISETLDAESIEGMVSDFSQALAFNLKKSKVITKSF